MKELTKKKAGHESLEDAIMNMIARQKALVYEFRCKLLEAERTAGEYVAEISRLSLTIDELSEMLNKSND